MTDAAPSAADRGANSPKTLKILVADDNADLAESLAALLQTHGHHVEIALDGEAALGAAIERVPDVALLDIGMPGPNGYDVARLLRSHNTTRGIYLVAITGGASLPTRPKQLRQASTCTLSSLSNRTSS